MQPVQGFLPAIVVDPKAAAIGGILVQVQVQVQMQAGSVQY